VNEKRKTAMSRSKNMSRVKSKDTKPEIFLRKLLWHEGFRYRINFKDLPGKPDIFIPNHNTAIFINGCFWHVHENCKLSTIPKTNRDFWEKKLKGNVERDKKNIKKLEDMGINVLVIWGCEIKAMEKNEEVMKRKVKELIKEIINRDKK